MSAQSLRQEEIRKMISAIEIASSASFTFGGAPFAVREDAAAAAWPQTQKSPLVTQLQNLLYQRCYCQRWRPENTPEFTPAAIASDPDFVLRLSQANRSVPRWDAGWKVRRLEANSQVWAEKGGVVRTLLPGEYMNFNGLGLPLKTGDAVSIYATKESTAVQPGLYFAYGETVMSSDYLDIVRFYWNIGSEGALDLLRRLSGDMNRYQVPFQFKCSVYRHGYDRRDAAVLYVLRKFYPIVRELVKAWSEGCASHLRDDVPLFTLRVENGVGLAEDPGTGESFGMNRCRHVAEALWTAHTSGIPRQQHWEEVNRHFQRHGLDLERPYLSPASVDRYRLPDDEAERTQQP
jgi:hypothetical protein